MVYIEVLLLPFHLICFSCYFTPNGISDWKCAQIIFRKFSEIKAFSEKSPHSVDNLNVKYK